MGVMVQDTNDWILMAAYVSLDRTGLWRQQSGNEGRGITSGEEFFEVIIHR